MRFEARELKSYAEPMSAVDLRVGEIYFTVQFADENLRIPVVGPLVFLGENLDERDADLLYFQDFQSYAFGIRYTSSVGDETVAFHAYHPTEINHIFALSGPWRS
jgi:hypothetical protein